MVRKVAKNLKQSMGSGRKTALIAAIHSFPAKHRPEQVFSDFVELAALSISNAVDRSQFDAREKRYLEVVKGYASEDLARFPEMLGLLTIELEERVTSNTLTDVLGETFMGLGLGNDRTGQFFTPYHVSSLMAKLTINGSQQAIEENGFLRLQEPACGAAGMVIAAAEAVRDAGYNYQKQMHATCIDIDARCVHMAYLQLSLLGIPAIVVHGNALTEQVWSIWQTPMHVLGGWRGKLSKELGREERRSLHRPGSPDDVVDVTAAAGAPCDVEAGSDKGAAPIVTERKVSVESPNGSAADIAALFEDVVRKVPRPMIFDVVEQMTLF
ncbi:N-6 DNA methylase (plasmid) [Robbsia andropogonis]|uniref:N-6 DNA methylase n=1 Tax=Robbsia andropogonis TaxID=28092 RepID=UPI003D1A6DDF